MKSAAGCLVAVACTFAFATAQLAQAQPSRDVHFDITAVDLGAALNELAQQSNRQIVFSSDATRGRRAAPLRGTYTPEAALDRLLEGSGLTYKIGPDQTIVVAPLEQTASRAIRSRVAPVRDSGDVARASEEIIVTARKRREPILSVPVVATAITQDTLERSQSSDLYAVANRVPGFVMGETVGTVGIQASLRGIGPTSLTATVDQSVSLNIDGLPLTQGYAFATGLFDVAQVEVLKGPQALFYGKNSTAGVISLRSADPTDALELIARGGFEREAREKVAELIASGPLAESLKLRLAMRYSDMDGFFTNTASPIEGSGNLPPRHRRFAPRESLMVRGSALFEPTAGYQMRLKLNIVDDRMEGSGGDGQLVLCPDGRDGVPPLNFPFIRDSDCTLDERTQLGDFDPAFWPGVRNGGVPFMDARQEFGTLEQNIALSRAMTLTSVTGFYDLRQDNLIRGSGSSNPTIAPDYSFANRQLTQELRLTSDFLGPLNFMLGGFYQDGDIQVVNRLRGNSAFDLPPLLQFGTHDMDIRSLSAFGQLLLQATEQIELAAGARWTDERRTHALFDHLRGSPVDLLVPRISADNVSPEFSVTYVPTPDWTLFVAYRQGFKSGSFNTIVVIDEATRADFGDEKAEGGEIGVKGRLLGRRLALDVAGYRYRYSDLQVGATDISEHGAIQLRTINAASATVQGVELNATYRVPGFASLAVYGDINYNRARFDRFDNAPCGNGQTQAEGCNRLLNPLTGRFTSQDLGGRALVRAPQWTAGLGVAFQTNLGDGVLEVGAMARYSDAYYTNLVQLPGYVQDSYVKTSANIAWKAGDGAWEVALIGNNLSNEITASTCTNSNTQAGSIFGGQLAGGPSKGPAGSDELGCVGERGRELWLRFTLRPTQWIERR